MSEETGQCSICGVVDKLSFEHVPPSAAFNDQRIFEQNLQEMLKAEEEGRKPKGKWAQRGAGRYTLCERCNSTTGSWYGTTYVSWARQAAELLDRSKGDLNLAYPYRLHPLRAIKQVTAMFCSVCGPALQKRFPEIPKFVLDPERRYLPYDLKVFAYLVDPNESEGGRQSPVVKERIGAKEHVFAEFAFAPLGFVLTGDVFPINADLLDISYFGYWPYHNVQTVFLKLPVLPIVSGAPGDFRTRDELNKQQQSGEKLGDIFLDVLK